MRIENWELSINGFLWLTLPIFDVFCNFEPAARSSQYANLF
jgi:hypothetical protein